MQDPLQTRRIRFGLLEELRRAIDTQLGQRQYQEIVVSSDEAIALVVRRGRQYRKIIRIAQTRILTWIDRGRRRYRFVG